MFIERNTAETIFVLQSIRMSVSAHEKYVYAQTDSQSAIEVLIGNPKK
jgi:hypothetical protein